MNFGVVPVFHGEGLTLFQLLGRRVNLVFLVLLMLPLDRFWLWNLLMIIILHFLRVNYLILIGLTGSFFRFFHRLSAVIYHLNFLKLRHWGRFLLNDRHELFAHFANRQGLLSLGNLEGVNVENMWIWLESLG